MYAEIFKEALRKHVILVMKNDAVIEGTVVSLSASRIKVVEYNQDIVVADLDEVSFIRIKASAPNQEVVNMPSSEELEAYRAWVRRRQAEAEKIAHNPDPSYYVEGETPQERARRNVVRDSKAAEDIFPQRSNDFSMPTPRPRVENVVRGPAFKRQT